MTKTSYLLSEESRQTFMGVKLSCDMFEGLSEDQEREVFRVRDFRRALVSIKISHVS